MNEINFLKNFWISKQSLTRTLNLSSSSPSAVAMIKSNRKQYTDALQKINASRYLFAVCSYLYDQKKLNLHFIDLLVKRFNEMVRDYKGIFDGVYISAKPLSENAVPLLTKRISQQYLKPGQTLLLKTQVDPSLQAGYILKIGINTYDHSVASTLRRTSQFRESALNKYQQHIQDTLKHFHPLIA